VDRSKIAYLLYNCFLTCSSFILLPCFIIRNLVLRRPVFPYFRNISESELARLHGKKIIWLQAVSVGEVVVANIIINELQRKLPNYAIVLSTTTPSGRAMAEQLVGDKALLTYFPFDIPYFSKRFVNRLQPEILILTETEIWPNAIRYVKAIGGKVAIINGIISDRSFRRYQRFAAFLKIVFSQVDLFVMQAAEYANRIGKLGAPLDRIKVLGNIKFDQPFPEFDTAQIDEFKQQYCWSETVKVFVAASTHRGEEEIVLEAYQQLIREQPYYLILAPRHPERAQEVINLLQQNQLNYIRRSSGESSTSVSILLLDTFGELGLAYAVADVVLVGGSLVNIGGHNILEAAAQSKPVIYGPYMHKAKESRRILEAVDAGFMVKDAAELVECIKDLLADPELYQQRARAAQNAVFVNKGSAANTAELIAGILEVCSEK
jgi:3-deoxy-D-manno-octulosonic-acid transferase